MKKLTVEQATTMWTQYSGNLCAQYKVCRRPHPLKEAVESHIERLRDTEPSEDVIATLTSLGRWWQMCDTLIKEQTKRKCELGKLMNAWFSEYDALRKG